MALTPINEVHALQIQAGALGRKAGHQFEDCMANGINGFSYPISVTGAAGHVFRGDPGYLLLSYVAQHFGAVQVARAVAISTGALATSEAGKQWLEINGVGISRCKSDIILTISLDGVRELTVGVSTKQCNNPTPTNAQLYFTTARGFARLLSDNGIAVSDVALVALRQFCGDVGFRPQDNGAALAGRLSDPRRYFWEEIDPQGRVEWERLMSYRQDEITKLLLQKAYLNDPFAPDFLIHKTKRADAWNATEVAIYSMDELIRLSRAYQGFELRPYSVRKGSYRDPEGVTHLAPRFGVVQMQRGGQAQHPDQLQFNLEAGYFYKI
ncbi:MAG TPA: hypothetical protein PLG97_00045 [Alcaligenes sp.]|nr:hypothetical protein [Alcaligenes sp.]HRL25881.1 hypothetical protein [Alcaligenes sp.]